MGPFSVLSQVLSEGGIFLFEGNLSAAHCRSVAVFAMITVSQALNIHVPETMLRS